MKKPLFMALSAALVALLLAACGSPTAATEVIEEVQDDPTAEPTAEMTEEPTEEPTEVPTSTPRPTPTLDPNMLFHPLSPSPVVTSTTIYTDPGGAVYHDGTFYMFANSFDGWPAETDILLYTSQDGVDWDKFSDEPIFDDDQISYAVLTVLASSVLVEDDGTWVLYFYSWESGSNQAVNRVGRATAPAPEGPWTVDPDPVLEPGPPGSWDDKQATQPSVVRTEDGYVMFYSGRSETNSVAVGRATSPDGIHWTKDPQPILQASENFNQWDGTAIWQPRVELTPDGWVMLYRATGSMRSFREGLAFSQDGITWTRCTCNPVIQPEDIPGGQHIYYTELVYADGDYYVFWELTKNLNSTTTQVFVSKHEGSLP